MLPVSHSAEDASAPALVLGHAPIDLFHMVLRKLPPENRVAFRSASRSTRLMSDAATEALAISKPNLITAELAPRFPNVKRLVIHLEDVSDTLNASSLDALLASCPLFLKRLHHLHVSFTGEWTVFASKLCDLLLCCSALKHVSLGQNFCNNLVLRHNWSAAFRTDAPGAIASLKHMLTQRAGIHKSFGTPAWCSLLTSLKVHHLMVIPEDPLAPYVLPSPSVATSLRSLSLHTNAEAIPHFLTSSLSKLTLLTSLDVLLEMHTPINHAGHPWASLARLPSLSSLAIRFIPADKYPNTSTDPFPIPYKWSRLTALTSLTLSAPSIHNLTPLSPLTSLLHLSLSSLSGPHPPFLPHLPNIQTLTLSHTPPPPTPPSAPLPTCDPFDPPSPRPPTLAAQLFGCFRPKSLDHCPLLPPTIPVTPILSHLPTHSLTTATFTHFPSSLLPIWPQLITLRTLSLTLTHPSQTPSLHPITALTFLQTLTLHLAELHTPLLHTLSSLPHLLNLHLHAPLLTPLRTPSTLPTLATLTLHAPHSPRTRSLLKPHHTPLNALLSHLRTPSLTALTLLPPCPIQSLKAFSPASYHTPKPCHFTTLHSFLALSPHLSPACITGLPTLFTTPSHLHLVTTHHPSFLTTNPISLASLGPHLGPACAAAAAHAPLSTLHILGVLPGYALRAACAPAHAAHLTSLDVSMAAMLPGEVCAALAGATRLRVLRLQHATLLGARPLAQLVDSCPLLEELHLHGSRLRPRSLSPVNKLQRLHTLVLQRYSGSAELLAVVAVLHPQLRPASLKYVAFTGVLASLCDVDWFVSAMPISGMLWAVDRVRVVPGGRKHQDILFEMSS